MSLKNEITNICKEIDHINQNINSNKFQAPSDSINQNTIFAAMEIRKKSDNSLYQVDKSSENSNTFINKNKKDKRKIFRVTYLRTAIPFLDIKSILNLSLLNKEFYHFLKSIYFYKFLDNVRCYNLDQKLSHDNFKTPKKSKFVSVGNTHIDSNYSATKMVGSLLGALTGAFSTFVLNSVNKTENKQISIDPRVLEEKINLHERVLKKKMENCRINLDLKEMRETINELIDNRKKKIDLCNSLKKNEGNIFENNKESVEKLSISHRQLSSGRLKSSIINDVEYEKIKREKLEKEYFALIEDLNQLKEEDRVLRNNIKILENDEIEKIKMISNIKNIINSNNVLENIQSFEKTNFKSGKNSELHFLYDTN